MKEINMRKLALAGLAAMGLLGTMLASAPAQAMPIAGLAPAVLTGDTAGAVIENVAWVCGPYRCHHVYRRAPPRAYYYARPAYRPWGWRHRRWHRW